MRNEVLLCNRQNLALLGGSCGVVNSLDFYLASYKPLFFYFFLLVYIFFMMEDDDSEFVKFTVQQASNLVFYTQSTIQLYSGKDYSATLKVFLKAVWVQAGTCCSWYRMPKLFFPPAHDLLVSWKMMQGHFHPPPPHPPSPSPCNSCRGKLSG